VTKTFQKAGDGFWSEVNHDKRRLRVFSEVTPVGEVGAVYDLDAKAWISREWADTLSSRSPRLASFRRRDWRGKGIPRRSKAKTGF
jgi:hypothetical protein